jgi:hypothetical protein
MRSGDGEWGLGNDCQRNGEETLLQNIPLTIIPLTTPPRYAPTRQAGEYLLSGGLFDNGPWRLVGHRSSRNAELFTVSAPACFTQRGPDQKINSRQHQNDSRRPEERNEEGNGDRGDHTKADQDEPGFALLYHRAAARRAGEYLLGDSFRHRLNQGRSCIRNSALQPLRVME